MKIFTKYSLFWFQHESHRKPQGLIILEENCRISRYGNQFIISCSFLPPRLNDKSDSRKSWGLSLAQWTAVFWMEPSTGCKKVKIGKNDLLATLVFETSDLRMAPPTPLRSPWSSRRPLQLPPRRRPQRHVTPSRGKRRLTTSWQTQDPSWKIGSGSCSQSCREMLYRWGLQIPIIEKTSVFSKIDHLYNWKSQT